MLDEYGIKYNRRNASLKTKGTQTIENIEKDDEFTVYMSSNKTFRLYYSPTYKENVLSFNFGQSKKYIITKEMWNIFRLHVEKIDEIMIN